MKKLMIASAALLALSQTALAASQLDCHVTDAAFGEHRLSAVITGADSISVTHWDPVDEHAPNTAGSEVENTDWARGKGRMMFEVYAHGLDTETVVIRAASWDDVPAGRAFRAQLQLAGRESFIPVNLSCTKTE